MTLFYFVAFLSIFFALMTIFTKNPVHSVLYLVITFFTFTVHYILLNAQFLAVVNFIVYMGAIMVLFLFVLMLLNLNKETEPMRSHVVKFMGLSLECVYDHSWALSGVGNRHRLGGRRPGDWFG